MILCVPKEYAETIVKFYAFRELLNRYAMSMSTEDIIRFIQEGTDS